MHQRIAHKVKANQFGQWCYLLNYAAEKVQVQYLFAAYDFGAKAALKIADIADFNIYLAVFFDGLLSRRACSGFF